MIFKGNFGDLKVNLGSGRCSFISAGVQALELELVHKLVWHICDLHQGGGDKVYPWALLGRQPSLMGETLS